MTPRPDRTFPFVRRDDVARGPRNDILWRTAAAVAKGYALRINPEDFLRQDIPSLEVYRAAVNPMAVGSSGAANALAMTAVVDAIIDLGGISAAANLFALAERRDFQGRASISVPSAIVTGADAGGFVAEGSPVPVRKRTLSALTLSPCKLLVMNEFSNEAARYSDFDTNNRDALTKATAVLLDSVLLSNTAAAAGTRPAGILNGLTSGTPTAAGADARTTDLRVLIAAQHAANAGARPVFIMAPEQFVVMSDKVGPKFNYPFFGSNALAAGTIICIDVSGFVFAYGSTPPVEFEISDQTALHEEDTSPAQLATGTGPTVATPIRSLWQTNTSVMKMRCELSWAVQTGCVNFLSSVNW
jgi:hypothetical protein